MELSKVFLAGGLLSVFALTACDNQEKKEADKAVVEAPVPTPVTPEAHKNSATATPAPEAHIEAPKTEMPKVEAPAAPAMEAPAHDSATNPGHSENKPHEGAVTPMADTVETPIEPMPENK